MRSRKLATIAAGLLLGAAGLLWAQAPTPENAPPPPRSSMMHGMAPGSVGPMMEQREQMMAERRAFLDQMAATDAKLDALLERMNAAQGNAKVDAMAEVVQQLVADRKAMRSMMESMPRMHGMAPGAGATAMPHPMPHPATAPPPAKNDSGVE